MTKEVTIKLIESKEEPKFSNGFSDVIGQEKVIEKLRFYIESHSNETPCPTFLFSGSHGLGKTYIAQRVAKSLGRKYVEVNCSNIKTGKELFENIFVGQVMGTKPVTILLDESHDLTSEVSNILLSILNPNKNHKNTVFYDGINYEFDLSLINFIFATTDAYMMFAPLKNRTVNIYFKRYEQEDIVSMLVMYLGLKVDMLKCDLTDLAHACRNRGRDTFLLASNLKRFLKIKSDNKNVLTPKDWDQFKDLFEIYPLGLNNQEKDLLVKIAENQPISASNLALQMMVNENNIRNELEIRLRELGLIESTTRGRILSETGHTYLKNFEEQKY